jgi:hypothetical protein
VQEYQQGHLNQVNFSRANFAPTHVAIMCLIKTIEANPYHSARLEMLAGIGEDGR